MTILKDLKIDRDKVGIFTFNYKYSEMEICKIQKNIIKKVTGYDVQYGRSFDHREVDDWTHIAEHNGITLEGQRDFTVICSMHSEWCQSVLEDYADQYEYIIFIDMDAYPMRSDSFDKLIQMTGRYGDPSKETVSGVEYHFYIPTPSDETVRNFINANKALEAFTFEELQLQNKNHKMAFCHPATLCVPTRLVKQFDFNCYAPCYRDSITNGVSELWTKYYEERYLEEPLNDIKDMWKYKGIGIENCADISYQLIEAGRPPYFLVGDEYHKYFNHCWGYSWASFSAYRDPDPITGNTFHEHYNYQMCHPEEFLVRARKISNYLDGLQ